VAIAVQVLPWLVLEPDSVAVVASLTDTDACSESDNPSWSVTVRTTVYVPVEP
jgi:hypothetical protein